MIYNLLTIAGTDYTTEERVTISKVISDYNTTSKFVARFNNYTGRYSATFNLNDDVLIKADIDTNPPTTKIFRGIIEDINYSGEENKETIEISGRDYGAILQDIIVSPRIFKDTEVSEIIKSLMRQNAQGTGITFNNVAVTATTITKITFTGVSLFDAISNLADVSGYYFYVDEDKDLNFKQKDAVSSGKTFDNTNVIKAQFKVSDDDIFNEVKILGGRQQTFAQQEFITGTDNTGSVYILNAKPYNVKVQLSGVTDGINTVYQPGGIIYISDPAKDNIKYLVDFNAKQVILTSGIACGDNVVPTGSIMIMDFFRSTPLIKTLRDTTSIAAYGLKKKEITNKNIADVNEATDIATTFIAEHKDPTIQGDLDIRGVLNITPGETAVVDIPMQNQNTETYSMIKASYVFTKRNCLADEVLSLVVSKKISNFIDLIKEHELRLRALEVSEVESSITNVELFNSNATISGTCVVIQKGIGSAFYFGVSGHDILNHTAALLGPIEGGSVVQVL